jgi:predicted enzyme related to lactoylglutathione lyase
MADQAKPAVGTIGWVDLTVDDAEAVRDFYTAVAGWTSDSVGMGEYNDYVMKAGDTAVGGVCHRRGVNATLPSTWLVYIVVADVGASTAKCVELGGKVLREPGTGEGPKYAVIEDPAGAVCALYQA